MIPFSIPTNPRQIINAISLIQDIPDATSRDFTLSLISTAPVFLHNLYFYHADFRTAGVLQFLRNITIDSMALTTPLIEYALIDPYTWLYGSVPQLWEKPIMTHATIGMIVRVQNGSGGVIHVGMSAYGEIELTTGCQITFTIT